LPTAGVGSSGILGGVKVDGTTISISSGVISAASGGIGSGQTWKDLSSSRSSAVTYTNTSGKPIMVSVHSSAVSNGCRIIMEVGGVTVNNVAGGAGGDGRWQVGGSFIVPDNTTYMVTFTGGALSPTLVWTELS